MVGVLFQKDQNVKLNNFLVFTCEAICCILKVSDQWQQRQIELSVKLFLWFDCWEWSSPATNLQASEQLLGTQYLRTLFNLLIIGLL